MNTVLLPVYAGNGVWHMTPIAKVDEHMPTWEKVTILLGNGKEVFLDDWDMFVSAVIVEARRSFTLHSHHTRVLDATVTRWLERAILNRHVETSFPSAQVEYYSRCLYLSGIHKAVFDSPGKAAINMFTLAGDDLWLTLFLQNIVIAYITVLARHEFKLHGTPIAPELFERDYKIQLIKEVHRKTQATTLRVSAGIGLSKMLITEMKAKAAPWDQAYYDLAFVIFDIIPFDMVETTARASQIVDFIYQTTSFPEAGIVASRYLAMRDIKGIAALKEKYPFWHHEMMMTYFMGDTSKIRQNKELTDDATFVLFLSCLGEASSLFFQHSTSFKPPLLNSIDAFDQYPKTQPNHFPMEQPQDNDHA